jgi:prepilin-type processing-associated H-X9-DG protein
MASDRTRELVLPLAILASVAVGAVIGRSFAGDHTVSSAPTGASPEETKELVDALQALRAELIKARELREEALGSTASLARTPAPRSEIEAGNLAKELRTATADLVSSGEALRQAADRARAERAPLIFPEKPPDPALLDAVASATYDVNARAYMLWTYQQILDRFGKPEGISHGDFGLALMYRSKSGRYVNFTFADGRVWQVSTGG